MTGPDGPTFEEYSEALADGIEAALPQWVVRSVERIMVAWTGSFPEDVAHAAHIVGDKAAGDVGGEIRRLLSSDIDEQWTTPLELVRGAVRYPSALLAELGAPSGERDEFSVRHFPDDVYGLTPASIADLEPSLAETAMAWGAAKAFTHLRRHREPETGF